MLQHLPAVVVVLTVLLQFGTMWAVGHARGKYGIKAPAISGHPDFERAWRVQMNTLESTVLFLPSLWLAVQYGQSLWGGVAGLVWVAGRVWYAVSYLGDAAKRGPGYMVSMAGWAATLLLGVVGLVRVILAA
ncbi:MAPEG family protein [Dyella japonica]|uniref:Membrane protein n=1 Tax=Dyella japonica A8 TaxID=1217721 RepID=A0A075JZR7_9GAMM|nr:MAPEG family protein [Dyella japonica]AIF47434.1 membrane protein [Dyella japonica A8]